MAAVAQVAPSVPLGQPAEQEPAIWYEWVEGEKPAALSFMFEEGKRELIVPYFSLSNILRIGSTVTFKFGNIEVDGSFSAKFPLNELLQNLRIQRVLAIQAIPVHAILKAFELNNEGVRTPI